MEIDRIARARDYLKEKLKNVVRKSEEQKILEDLLIMTTEIKHG